jgi:hypothetical protein
MSVDAILIRNNGLLWYVGHYHAAWGLFIVAAVAGFVLLLASLAIRRARKQLFAYDFNCPDFDGSDHAWRWSATRGYIALKITALRLVSFPLILIVAGCIGDGMVKAGW